MKQLHAKDIPSVDPTGAGLIIAIVAMGERILREVLEAKREVVILEGNNAKS